MLHNSSPSQDSNPHPSTETWMEYVYGEISPGDRSTITAHLAQCASCRKQLQTWQATQRDLSSWQLNHTQSYWHQNAWSHWFRWGIAAILILGIGILIGRATDPGFDKTSLVRAITPEIRKSILDELKHSMASGDLQDFTRMRAEYVSEISASNQQETALLAAKLVAGYQEKSLAQILEVLEQRQRASVAYLSAYLDKLEKQYSTSFSSMRQDLETLALSTEGEFWRSRRNMSQLVSMTQKISPQDANQTSVPQNEGPKPFNTNP